MNALVNSLLFNVQYALKSMIDIYVFSHFNFCLAVDRIRRFYILSCTMAVNQSISISIILTIDLLIFVGCSLNHPRLCFSVDVEYDRAFLCNK